jgi:hypothetical protein
MHAQGQTDLSLDHAVDEQPQYRQHREGRDPCGLLQPHGSARRGILEPAKAGFYSGLVGLIGPKNVGSRTARRGARGGQHRPPIVLFSIGQSLDFDLKAIARLPRRGLPLRRTSSTGAARAARCCHTVIADRMIPPQAWAAASSSLAPALLRSDRRFGIGQAGEPPGVHVPHVVGPGGGFLLWGRGIGLGLLLG